LTWLEEGLLSEAQFRLVFGAWEEGPHVFCRPPDFDGIDATLLRRFGVELRGFRSTQLG